MNVEELRIYCLSKKHVTESFPFDESTLVFKVADKMFALTGLNRVPHAVNLKCNPEEACHHFYGFGERAAGSSSSPPRTRPSMISCMLF